MFDMDEMRVSNGTAADFSNWNGVKADGNFKPMKITSSEPIIKRKMEKKEQKTEEINKQEIMDNFPTPPKLNSVEDFAKDSIAKEKVERSEMPGVQQAYLNPNELKEIAIKLMPTVDRMPDYTKESIRAVSENAINIAFEFLQVWNEKVSIGE